MKNKTKATMERVQSFQYKLILEGIGVGILTGLVVSLFRLALEKAEFYRNSVLSIARESMGWIFVAIGIWMISYIVVWFSYRKEPLCSGSGIPQVKGELKGQIEQRWYTIIPAKFIGGVFAIGSGLSMGREGPSIQLGAMVGKGFSKLGKKLRTEEKMLMTCGAGAGLSGAFCAPLAGVVFSLEELHKNFSTEVLLSTMAASVASDFVASYIFGLNPVFDLTVEGRLPLSRYWMVICLGLILGVFGVFYNKVTAWVQDLYDKIGRKSVKMMIPFILLIPLAIMYPMALGSGHHLVSEIAGGEFALGAVMLLLVMKFVFSIICFGSGAPGGIFLPLLVLGAITGGAFAEGIGGLIGYEEPYIAYFVILGMTGYFSAIVRAPITGVILITEMTGDFKNFLALAVVALVAYIVADLLNGKPIYDQLMYRMLSKDSDYGRTDEIKNKKVLIDSDVYIGSLMDGEEIEHMLLPKGCLVVSVQRDGREVVPNGATVLKGGDKLVVLCTEGYLNTVEEKLDFICHRIKN